MTSKEALNKLYFDNEDLKVYITLNDNKVCKIYNIIKDDLDKLENLEKIIKFLNKVFKFELGVSVVNGKYHYSLEHLLCNPYISISMQLYDLLKEYLNDKS